MLLLDLGLPGLDGLQVLARLRSSGCQVPVLIVTARDDLHSVLTLNPATYQVQIAGQTEPVALSNKEFAVLQALMMRPGTIFSRSDLEDKIYGWGEEVESNAVDFLIHSLRKKLGKEHIRNVRGVGWLVEKGDA